MARSTPVHRRALPPATWRTVEADGSLGEPQPHPVQLDADGLRDLYRRMAVGRRVDRQAVNLTRQGALGVYASSAGQEAVEVGAVAALEPQDWLFPTYRDSVAVHARGVDIVEILALFRGSRHSGFDSRATRVAPLCTPLATQVVHATGLAMAARRRGDDVVALTFLGDGAASEGDAHEAMNMAGVDNAPVVFVLQNNQYAISVPLRLQTNATALVLRASGYGIAGVRVDGNDVLSVYGAVRDAVDRARSGGGPTLVEAVTYRMGAHTTADDPTRYRTDEEVAGWVDRDPLVAFRALLLEHGVLDEETISAVDAEGEREAERMRAALFEAPDPDPREMFTYVHATPRAALAGQRAQLDAELAAAAASR